ncbi:MAG: PBP1A family penicillin-binding protein [Acidobacteria bacterium]|nr:PBP1A family penicillin-binding protein [Acidobacteriota bacterium]
MAIEGSRVWLRRFVAVAFALLVGAGGLTVAFVMRHSIAINRLTRGVGDTVFHAADGRPWFRMDEQRQDVRLSQIATSLQQAVIAIEDRRFYRHPGIDPIGIGRAVVRNLRARSSVEGGSTLTQQLARTLFLSNARTYNRKLKEALLALMIEDQLSKDQILELYLNRVYLSAGVYGVEPMALKLLGKHAHDVSLAEAALIAGLIRSPGSLSPWSNLDGALRRRDLVLAEMRQAGFISEAEARRAGRVRMRIRSYRDATNPRAAYAKDYLRQQFRNRFGGDHPPDWQVNTTFIPELQELAEHGVANGLRRFADARLQAALVALDPETGDILALVGGRDYRVSPFNRATKSHRQPGSAFKPFVFAAALERGMSPVSILTGLASMEPAGREEWTPRNVQGEVPDELTLRAALVESNNRAAVALQRQIGSRPVIRLAGSSGLQDMPDVPSLALGTGLVTPLDLTAAFAVFPNGGDAVRPRGIVRVIDAEGSVAFDRPVQRERILSEASAFQMVSMLRDVIDRGTGTAARSHGVRFPAGGKTGTTDDFKDAWFVGFSRSMVVGVWVGLDQPASIGRQAFGGRVALPIWADFMRHASRIRPPRDFVPPSGLREEALCRVSYLRAVEECPTYIEYFKQGDVAPGRLCTIHRGSFKQQVRRAVEGLFSVLGRRLRDIFR